MIIRFLLRAALLAVPFGVSAQVTVFSDNFSGASTVNSLTPTTPTASSTSYEIIASKNYSPNPTITSGLKFGIATTTGGGGEVQALFAATPVAMTTSGDYIQLTMTFTNMSGLLNQQGEFGIGMFNSGGSLPWAGGLMNAANSTTSTATNGGAKNWNGYLALMDWTDNNKGSRIFTRAPQTTNDNRVQVTTVPGNLSVNYGYSNPRETGVNSQSATPNLAMIVGGVYSDVLKFTLQGDGSIQILNNIYTNDATGTLLSTQTATTPATPLTNSFDAFAMGFRPTGNLTPTTVDISSIQVVKFLQGEAPACVSAAFVNTGAMVVGQTNGSVNITIPSGSTTNGALSVDLVSANPAVAYPAGASGGTLTVTFAPNLPYSLTNVPVTVVAAGSSLFYLTNATSACISGNAFSSVVNVASNTVPNTYIPPALPVIPAGIFNITNYGAIGDGVTVNTTAIQATVNAALTAGGGTVEVPPGTFLTGPFSLGSKLRFQLDSGATLLMLPYGTYPGGTSPPDFISVNDAHDLEFCGPGVLDGQGAPWWAANLNESQRPYAIHLDDCQRVFFHDWNSTNPPMKHIVFDGNDSDITVQNVADMSPHSPNTDGINLQGDRCLVQNCVFRTGDDCIAMGRSSGVGNNIMIRNITCGIGHGISIGSITRAGASNITVMNCTFDGTDYGLRLKSDIDRGGMVQNITYANITLTNVASAILIYSFYNDGKSLNVGTDLASSYAPNPVTSQTPIWRNITFSNITAWTTVEAGILWGRPEMLVSNVTLDHVTINSPKTFRIYNARGVSLVDTRINQSSGSKYTLYNAEVTITNRTSGAPTVSIDGLTSSNTLALYNAPASMSTSNLFGVNPLTLSGSSFTNTGNLTLPAAGVLNFVVGTNNSLLAETGNLNLNSTINVTAGDGFKSGTYTLLRSTGSLSGSPALGSTPVGYQCSLNTNTIGQVRLVVSAMPPWIGNFNLGGSGATISGTGGPANSSYYLLSSTNVTLPLANWTRLATNVFDGSGNFSVSNLPSADPQMFYLLQVP